MKQKQAHAALAAIVAIGIPVLVGFVAQNLVREDAVFRQGLPPSYLSSLITDVHPVIYTGLAGLGVYLVYRQKKVNFLVKTAVSLFAVQLLWYMLWYVIMYNTGHLIGAMLVISVLLLNSFVCLLMFLRISVAGAALSIPLFLWVISTTYANFNLLV